MDDKVREQLLEDVEQGPSKADVISEVEPIRQLLSEVVDKLQAMPRAATAARNLALIVTKLEGWQRQYEPGPQSHRSPYPLEEVQQAKEAYHTHGYFELTERQKEIMLWLVKGKGKKV